VAILGAHSSPIRRVLAEYRVQLTFTYALFALEMLGSLLRPYFLALAVNGLLAGDYHGLIVLSAVHLAWIGIGTARHMYDTRTFSAIYTTFVTRMLSRPADEDELSKRSALSNLARQVTDFLAYDVNYVAEAVYNIVGSLLFLLAYDRAVAGICLAILVPVTVLGQRYGRTVARLNRHEFDELERQVDIIGTHDATEISGHYARLRSWQVRISDREAWNFGSTEFFVLLCVAGSLLASTRTVRVPLEAGSIIGMYVYLLKFASGLETIPYTVQRLGALRDILRRVSEAQEG
jgi:ABC-type multidrug transport system fused ATPase/permease subunit